MKREFPLEVRFFRTETNNEPVREWLKSLPLEAKKAIGRDIKTAQYTWPIGMPLVRNLHKGIWEIRTDLEDTISRVIFTMLNNKIVLLHGFIKKTKKTPKNDLELAIGRTKQLKRG